MIPFVDLKAQYQSIKEEVNGAIQGVLDSCQFTLGSEVVAFEQEFAAYSGSVHGMGVNTGTSASGSLAEITIACTFCAISELMISICPSAVAFAGPV